MPIIIPLRRLTEQEKEKAAQNSLRQGKLEMAQNMLKTGADMKFIVQVSGLSEEEVRRNSER